MEEASDTVSLSVVVYICTECGRIEDDFVLRSSTFRSLCFVTRDNRVKTFMHMKMKEGRNVSCR